LFTCETGSEAPIFGIRFEEFPMAVSERSYWITLGVAAAFAGFASFAIALALTM
jgi:hypothetical protein